MADAEPLPEGSPPAEPPPDGPPPETIDEVFSIYETRTDGERLLYFGQPRGPRREVMRTLWPAFREAGYELHLHQRLGEHVLVAEPHSTGEDGVPWTNVILFVMTVLSTLLVGAVGWYYVPPAAITSNPLALLRAWPFTVAVLGVLGVHELGHYVMSRYHDVDASLPYFIPVPTIFGTMGAVIRMRGQMPDRKALFDIGVAGPLAGLAATVVVTIVGFTLQPVPIPGDLAGSGTKLCLGNPPLLVAIAEAMGYGGERVHPVVMGGWVGMFVTALNLIPVGQLDGGHILRAMAGRRQESVASFVPAGLFGLAGYLYYFTRASLADSVLLWLVWGGFAVLLAAKGPAHPVDDSPLGARRYAVGLLTFGLGLACFTPIPFMIAATC